MLRVLFVLCMTVCTTAQPDFTVDLASNVQLAWRVTTATTATLQTVDALEATLTYQGTGWIAMAFSDNTQMSDSDAVIYMPAAGTVDEYRISARSSAGIVSAGANSRVLTSSWSQAGGVTTMTYTFDLSAGVPAINADVDVLWAYGSSNTFTRHQTRAAAIVNFQTGASRAAGRESKDVAHGAIMFVAWGILLPMGAIVARFKKPDQSLWFKFHVGIQIIGLILAIIGFVIAISIVDSSQHFERTHHRLGLVVMIMGILQPINGLLRPHATAEGATPTTARRVWEFWHKGVGYAALVVGFAAIWSGLHIIEPEASSTVKVLAAVYGIGLILVFVFLSVVRGCSETKAQTSPSSRKSRGSRGDVELGDRPVM